MSRRFLVAMQEAYRKVLEHGVRSNEKTKALHGWVQEDLRRELGNAYSYTGQSPISAQEAIVAGRYYNKKVNVLVARDDQELGVVDVRFVISNYWQNAINYIEQQIGETANLRRRNIVYGNLFCVTNPIPYKNRAGAITKRESIREQDIQRYARLRADHEHIHAPDEMAIGIVDLDTDRDAITGITDLAKLGISDNNRAVLDNELAVAQFFSKMARHIEERHLSA